MSITASMINLEYQDRLVFAVPVPEWSSQHEMVINPITSWIKYPSPNGWHWLKMPLDEDYIILGLSTPVGLKSDEGILVNKDDQVFGTIIRSHIITNASKYGIRYTEEGVYLIVEMFFKIRR